MAQAVHARKGKVIYVNKTAATFSLWKDVIDFHVEMDCDRFVKLLKGNHPGVWMKQTKVDKLMKLALMKNAPEDKENLAARPKAKVKRAGARNPLIQKVANGEVQKKRKAGDSGGAIKDQPTPVNKTRVRHTKKASSRSGRKQPANANITKPANSSVAGSAKESQDGNRPAKRLKIAEPIRKSKGAHKTGSTITKAKSPTIKRTKGSKDARATKRTSSRKMRNARPNAKDTNAAKAPPARRLALKGVFVGPKELKRNGEGGNGPTIRSKRSGPHTSKADPRGTKVQDSIKVQAEAPAVDDTKVAPGTPFKKTTSTGPYTRSTGLPSRSMKVGECAPIPPGAEATITCQPSPPTTTGSRIEKRCPSDPLFLVAFDHPLVPSTPSRSRKSKWDDMLPVVRLNTPERSCSPSPSSEFPVEIASPRKMNHFLDRAKALKSEPKEDLATQGPNIRRSARARRNTIL